MAKKKTVKRTMRDQGDELKQIERVSLSDLHIDPENPRFGMDAGKIKDEAKLVDYIVEQFGVQDVLSSIAVNGYFASEPLLVRRRQRKLVVAEGNRRLTACLILAGDPRAKNQKKRTVEYQEVHQRYGSKSFDPIPIVVFENKKEQESLLPYLGVRHIAGAQEWDSYAKAAWVAQTVEGGGLGLEDVIHMIGDNTNLARRMLQGYYIVEQLIGGGFFNPNESVKSGLRSESQFPFSWVYTILGYSAVNRWLRLPSEPEKNPLEKKKMADAGRLFAWMFGQEGTVPVIRESRQLGKLAQAIADPDKRRLLRAGHSIQDVEKKTRPIAEQIADGLSEAHSSLSHVFASLGEERISTSDAEECLSLSSKVRRLSMNVYKALEEATGFTDGEDD